MTVQDDPRDCREALKQSYQRKGKAVKLHLTPGELRKLSVINDEDIISVSKKTGKKAYYHTRTNQYQEEVA